MGLKFGWWGMAFGLALAVQTGCLSRAEAASGPLSLTVEEQRWLQEHPQIPLCFSADFPPNLFLDAQGQAQGYIPELYALLSQQLGIEITLNVDTWPKAVQMAKQHQCAGLALVRKLDQWRSDFVFSNELFYTYSYLYVRSDQNPVIHGLSDLRGQRVAYLRHEIQSERLLAADPGVLPVPFDDADSSVLALNQNRVAAILGSVGIEFKRVQNQDPTFKIADVLPQSKAPVVIAVRKDWPVLAQLLDKAFENLDPDVKRHLQNRWYGNRPEFESDANPLKLSASSLLWLKGAPEIRVRLVDAPPFVMSHPQPSGIAAMVLFTRRDSLGINGLDSLAGQRVAMVADGQMVDDILREFPGLRVVTVGNPLQALEALATGTVDAYLGGLTTANYLIREHHFDNLMVVSPVPGSDLKINMAVRPDWLDLVNVLNQGLASLTPEQRTHIAQRWGVVEYKPHVDYTLVWQFGLMALTALLFFYLWNRSLSREIKRRESVEQELRQAMTLADAANKAKTDFLANMSHEIRTPLNAVIGLGYLLEKGADPAEQLEQIRSIRAASGALLGIVNNVLDLAKVEAGELELEHKPVQLQAVLDEVQHMMQPAAQAKGLVLSMPQFRPEWPAQVLGDAVRLRQILLNLVGNAVKFTAQGRVDVRLDITAGSSAHRVRLCLAVEDTGIGIAPAVLPKLFKPFTQADASMTRRFGGTGLGLTIVKQLSERMGGQVTVRSEEGKGTCFRVELPFELPTEAAQLEPNGAQHEPSQPLPAGDPDQLMWLPNVHVLLVDDSLLNLKIGQKLLERQGAVVTTATDGQMALDVLKSLDGQVDLVLMDIQMPVMDGNAAVMALRTNPAWSELPVIGLTGGALLSEREKSLKAGMNDYLTKPLDPDLLVRVVRYAVQRYRKHPIAVLPRKIDRPAENNGRR
ncbi:transporter substrate-binding domain-containing protein [Limnobacter humi]|uniref:histidine kinase n=1 Tax=Limnobacter humi TaxID=1778671 RepID=A0ABT1WGY3_9BURK|nr:transporter substrate-binding domain-containing protein [Limnobacter humi]MCQ8896773.1 transporter substrate-binding domain-containing protein [Limnobacter humi]